MLAVVRADPRIGPNCREALQEAIDYVNRVAGIARRAEFIAEVRTSSAKQVITGSYHWLGVIKLQIPTRKAFPWDELLGAVAHEYKHHIQCTEAPSLREFFETNSGEYWDQPCEVEAREFAEEVVQRWWREEAPAYFAGLKAGNSGSETSTPPA